MAEYVVRSGDTLYGIARRHGIRYWPNLYLATENNSFRSLRPNPNQIYPGDRVGIPSRESVAPMEAHPVVVHRDVPLFTQSAETCWRATGKMLYLRRFGDRATEATFNRSIGERYRTLESGLESEHWTDFYHTRLGMRETVIASPNDLHRTIANHGPVIAAIGDSTSAHSMVVTGYDVLKGRWLVLDPAAGESITFEAEEITVGESTDSSSSSPARLTDFRTGPATWENMSRWLWIFDTSVHQRIFHYE